MSEQTLKRIFTALAVLVVFWLGSFWFTGRSDSGPVADGGLAAIFAGPNENTVSAVRIAGPGQTVSLQQSGGAWTASGHPADSTAIERFWFAVAAAEVGGVVANNPNNHMRMGLVADSAWTVDFTMSDGGTASVLVGKVGPIAPSAYVRLPAQDEVVVVSGDFLRTVVRDLADWRDKTVLRVDTAAVARVVLQTDEGTRVIQRSDRTWSADGEPANNIIVFGILQELSSLLALGFVEESGDVFDENPTRVIALGASGDTLGVVLITGDADTRHARTPGSEVVFEIPDFRADRIAPDLATLLAPNSEAQ